MSWKRKRTSHTTTKTTKTPTKGNPHQFQFQFQWRHHRRNVVFLILAMCSKGVAAFSMVPTGGNHPTIVSSPMISSTASTGDYNFWEEPLSIQSFNMDLHNLAMEDPQKAQDALDIMEQLYHQHSISYTTTTNNNNTTNDNNDNNNYSRNDDHTTMTLPLIRPDAASYTTVMEGWSFGSLHPSHDKHVVSAEQVQSLLDRMEQSDYLQPNELCYLMACQQWADAVEGDTGQNVQRAQAILDRLLRQSTKDNVSVSSMQHSRRRIIPISAKLYTIVLEAWCRRVGKIPHAMDKVESLLQDMENGTNELLPRPNVLTYTSVIGGLARSRKRDLATRAMQLLARMRSHGVQPDMVAYTSLLNCWAKTTSREERQYAHTQALHILQEMEDLYIAQQEYHVKPTAITYATAIKAIGNSLADDAPAIAERVLHRMYNWTESGSMHVPPTVEVYNALIMSLSQVGGSSRSTWSRSTRAYKAEQWLLEMYRRTQQGELGVEPNVRTWGAVFKGWAESGRPDAGEQAQRLLDQMEEWYQTGKSSVAPNVVCYTTVMNAWARGTSTSAKVALKRVEQILTHMENLYQETGDSRVRPNKITYISVIDAWCRKAKKNQAAIQAQAIVDRMMKLYALNKGYDRPTRIVFNALINAYSKSDDPSAAAQAENIFRWMEEQYRAGDEYVKPDEISLCGVLNAWANHATNGGALRAQQILDHTESLTCNERGFGHSIVCYNILIKAWGRSREPDSVQRAEAILQRLEETCCDDMVDRIRPDVTTYSSVINGCAYYVGNDTGRQAALEVARRTFRKIQDKLFCLDGPNNITFGTMFKAIAKLMPIGTERDDLVKTLFGECIKLGQVDSFVLSQVKAASTTAIYRRLVLEPANLMAEDESNYEKILKAIPPSWSCNIVVWEG